MKKFLIIIFTFIFVVSAGLLTYGVIMGPKKPQTFDEVSMDAPSVDLFLGDFATQRINMATIAESETPANQKVAEMLVKASYNNLMIDRFYFKAHVDVQSTKTDDFALSDYFHAKTGMNIYHQVFAYTGLINPASVKVEYETDRLDCSDTADYDEDTKTWSTSLTKVKRKDTTPGYPDMTPYHIYSWYDFPLDLGGLGRMDKNKSKEGRTEEIDGSLIDASSVKIETIGEATPYYRVTFNVIISAANASEETIDRYSDSCGKISEVTIKTLSFTVDIWKDTGVFRSIGFESIADASLSGKKGEVEIKKTIAFSYDANDASVAAHIKTLADQYDPKWLSSLSPENQTKLNEELAKLPSKKSADSEASAE